MTIAMLERNRNINSGKVHHSKPKDRKVKVTNETIFYHVKSGHQKGACGIYLKHNLLKTQICLLINKERHWFKLKDVSKMVNRKLKRTS